MTASNSINNFSFESAYLGLYDYEKAAVLQNDLHCLALNKNQYSLIGLEHYAVLTLGHRAQVETEVKMTTMPVVRSTRGGLATVHSEGQLVIYPIINLRKLRWGVKHYVHCLLTVTQALLKELEIDSWVDDEAIGLHTRNGKIAFCGIQIKNGVSQHGISLNVKNDLSLFTEIKACGLQNPRLDRLANYTSELSLRDLFNRWTEIFKRQINNS
ncbi:MAG: lipoyl(octanoyl) transferase LipB [Bdellovibrionaceae bacterium]|nr:lipoyl(octanoyl) transferase LipB [Bdellovibrio sp.]